MGEQPDWWAVVSAARWLGCSPWELLEQGIGWTHIALAHEEVTAKMSNPQSQSLKEA